MHFLTHQRFECTSHTYIDAQGNINLIAMKVSAKSLLIVTVICSLVVSSIPSMTPAAAEATISTEDDDEVSTPNIWCVDNSQGSDWTNGCSRGEKFCMDGFPYAPAPANSATAKGFIAGWEHAGCTSQK